MSLLKKAADAEIPVLKVQESLQFPPEFDAIRLHLGWNMRSGGAICELDLTIFCFDERVQLAV
jgi:hypothetical protein